MPDIDMSVNLRFFRERNYERMQCPCCGGWYWGIKGVHARCGDTPCVEYSFIGAPKTIERFDVSSMRERYLSFFEKRGHTRIGRYPVIARWRDDVFLVNASIYDFQPHVTSGQVPPPANPLTISQPCIRLTDLDSVGRSGRHLSNFEMMAHHAFNLPGRMVYWKEECTAYCHELLTKELGIPESDVTYKENPWMGGGNAGMALEVMVAGLELATLVFMDLKLDEKGTVELGGDKYGPMPLSVVDTGYGLERFVWVSQGTPTIYDSIYPGLLKEFFGLAGVAPPAESTHREVLAESARLAGIMNVSTGARLLEQRKELLQRLGDKGMRMSLDGLTALLVPIENVFTIADHSRCVLLMLADGIVPSNVKAGYLARLIIRKTLRIMDEMRIEVPLADLVLKHLATTKGILRLGESEEVVRTMLELEVRRYRETTEKGGRMVRRIARELGAGKTIPVDRLVELYDTHGIHPAQVQAVAAEEGMVVEVPDAFTALVASRHASEKKEEAAAPSLPKELGPTHALYYENPEMQQFSARVLHVFKDSRGGDGLVLDRTAFYPEGGGQHPDKGWLELDGQRFEVFDVQKVDGVILHKLDKPVRAEPGTIVKGSVDWRRRMAHSRHHTATHIIIGSARKVLGPHVWQAGAEKTESGAHVDISHYDRVGLDQLHEIEKVANEVVAASLPVEFLELTRDEAERRYGMLLYQGGAPAGATIRVIRVGDFDSEACGGTHVRSTGEVGLIKITRADRIQDGIVRLEYSASLAALETIQKTEKLLLDAASEFRVPPDQLPKTARRFFEEWKMYKNKADQMIELYARGKSDEIKSNAERVALYRVMRLKPLVDVQVARTICGILSLEVPDGICIIPCPFEGILMLSSGKDVKLDLSQVARRIANEFNGSGGGKMNFAQVGKLLSKMGDPVSKAHLASERAFEIITQMLSGK
jgi:alanyl-tRNA synthetase